MIGYVRTSVLEMVILVRGGRQCVLEYTVC